MSFCSQRRQGAKPGGVQKQNCPAQLRGRPGDSSQDAPFIALRSGSSQEQNENDRRSFSPPRTRGPSSKQHPDWHFMPVAYNGSFQRERDRCRHAMSF
jgi:hypothetical protein